MMGDKVDIERLEAAEELIEHLDRERAELMEENWKLREQLKSRPNLGRFLDNKGGSHEPSHN